MRFIRRAPEAPALVARVNKTRDRAPVLRCFACHQMSTTYVYAENTNDYCLSCAADSYAVMGLRPGGRRRDDITLDHLIEYETGVPRRPLSEIWNGRPVLS